MQTKELHHKETLKDGCSEVREKIIRAAQERLWHYGFKKTTIDEIAADAGVGKGTIYLHFSSKEEIALEIIAQFKQQNLDKLRSLAADTKRPILERIKAMLLQPILMAHARCNESPAAMEMVAEVRPNIQAHLKPLHQQEIEILAQVLEEGNSASLFTIDDTLAAAQSLKYMCTGFMPPTPCVSGEDAIREAVEAIADLVFQGLCGRAQAAPAK